MRNGLGLTALAILLAAGVFSAGSAQERPPAMPTRDVAVSYKVDDAPPTVDTVAWLASEGRIRTEGKSLINRVAHLIDTRGGGVVVVVDADRTFHDLGRVAAVMTRDILPVQPAAKLTKEGADSVAGHPCTVWRIEPEGEGDPDGARRACVTADGVPLRLVEGSGADASTLYVATSVAYGPQDPARFRIPAGYRPLSGASSPRRR
jgi:hypothetical protein